MKKHFIVGLVLTFVASSAAASVVTPGADFTAVDGDIAGLIKTVSGCYNQGSAQVTALGGLKRQPATSPDGSQTVTINLTRPNTTQSVNGAIWATGFDFIGMRTFSTNASDTGTLVTKTVTVPSTLLSNTSNLSAIVYMAPQVQVITMTVN
jgi:hypothetical protein